VKRIFFIVVGLIALLLGILGVFLPLLPTTPFLLLAAFCFGKSSKKFHDWLMNHPVLSPPLKDWQENRVIRFGPKVMATSMLAASGIFVYLSPRLPMFGKYLFLFFAFCVLFFLWTRKSK